MTTKMTASECQSWLNEADTWQEYGKRYNFLMKNVPNDIRKAKSWAQIESFPHLMFQLCVCYKGLRYWDKKGFIS